MILIIIDDSANIRKVVEKAMKMIPQITKILHAGNVEDGAELILKYNPALTILDLMLKTGTAFDVLDKIKDSKNFPYIILYSNFLSKEYIKKAKKMGVHATFDKSGEIFGLVELVKNVVSLH